MTAYHRKYMIRRKPKPPPEITLRDAERITKAVDELEKAANKGEYYKEMNRRKKCRYLQKN